MPSEPDRPFRVAWAEVTIDCVDVARAAAFWSGLLALEIVEPGLPGWARAAPAVDGGPVLNFQPVPTRTREKTRVHLDLWTDDLDAAVRWVREYGGMYSGEAHVYDEGTVVVMRDPEGIEFCLVGPAGAAPPS
jgi:predicted enzyme related to lactoylglutathione lyase